MKGFEARILGGVLRDHYRLAMFGNPARDALPHAQFQAINHFSMRILGSAQNQVVAFAHIDKAGVALHHGGRKFDDAFKVLMKWIVRSNAAADIVQKINIQVVGQ